MECHDARAARAASISLSVCSYLKVHASDITADYFDRMTRNEKLPNIDPSAALWLLRKAVEFEDATEDGPQKRAADAPAENETPPKRAKG